LITGSPIRWKEIEAGIGGFEVHCRIIALPWLFASRRCLPEKKTPIVCSRFIRDWVPIIHLLRKAIAAMESVNPFHHSF